MQGPTTLVMRARFPPKPPLVFGRSDLSFGGLTIHTPLQESEGAGGTWLVPTNRRKPGGGGPHCRDVKATRVEPIHLVLL